MMASARTPPSNLVAGGLPPRRRAERLHDVADGEHADEEGRVVPVGLHTVALGPEHLAHRADAGGQPQRVERALEAEAGRARLVDGLHRLRQLHRPRGDGRGGVAEAPPIASPVSGTNPTAAMVRACASKPMLVRYDMAGTSL